MIMNKEYKTIMVEACGEYNIRLVIELNRYVDMEWQHCYQEAILRKGTHTSWRSSGAPTIDNVSFVANTAVTTPFPNNELTKREAKDFLNEFNETLVIANQLFDNLQKQKENELRKKEEAAKKQNEQLQELNDYFNN